MEAFYPAVAWVAPRDSYVFKRGVRGIGYYKDVEEVYRHFGDVALILD